MNKKRNQGFTLLEILLAVAALVILASIVILALNPGKQLADTRNAQRSSDVNTILNAIYQYAIDNSGDLPATMVSGTVYCINTSDANICSTHANRIDLATGLVPDYIVGTPQDPRASAANSYNISVDANGRVTVAAPLAEESKTISVTR